MSERLTPRLGWMRWRIISRTAISILALLLATTLLGVGAETTTVIVHGATGTDTPGCGAAGSPCQTIGYALAQHGDQDTRVLIGSGTYTENLSVDGNVTLQGGYILPHSTSLSGMPATIIDGGALGPCLTIHGGLVRLVGIGLIHGKAVKGGGVRINGGTVDISYCAIGDNQANLGGGLSVSGGDTHLALSHSQVYSNTATQHAGGGLFVDGATVAISDSVIEANSAPSGQSGAIELTDNSTVTVDSTLLASNSSRDHGGVATLSPNASLTFTNCVLTGNSTETGNANVLANNGGTATFVNCTVVGNNPTAAQAVLLWAGSLVSTNSIWWDNAFNLQADPPCETCLDVTYSNIQGGFAGVGNMGDEPMFVGGGDYRLAADSPCIDAGTDVGAPDHDMLGVTRPQDGNQDGTAITDMGAYELAWHHVYLPLVMGRPAQ